MTFLQAVSRGVVLALLACASLAASPASAVPAAPSARQADTVSDPREPGPYQVGTTRRTVSRTAVNGETRSLEVVVWYPAQSAPGAPPATAARSDAPSARDGRPFPVVV